MAILSRPVADSDHAADPVEHSEFAWRWLWLTLAAGIGAGVALTVLLWGDTPADHRAAFDAGWRGAATVLAIFAAFLAVSRVRLGQREHRRQVVADHATRQDAVARQITELATRAGEQLGAANTATRIGGLAALDRLAQTHPDLRQTVVDQICAYLRRPYGPPPKRVRTLARDTASAIAPTDGGAGDVPGVGTVTDDSLELDVRRTAQEILRRHLLWPAAIPEPPRTFWADIAIDLRDAVLVDLDFGYCRVHAADFADADFHGTATFTEATFLSVARFDGARFGGTAGFRDATFHRHAEFTAAVFGGDASFGTATFRQSASFEDTTFHGTADFAHTTFDDPPYFQRATFAHLADFDGATFARTSEHTETTHQPDLPYARMFRAARVLQPDGGHCWPPDWRFLPDRQDGAALLAYLPETDATPGES